MSANPPPAPVATTAAAAPAPKAPVIRVLETAHETAQERLMRKHLPAWVISGAINIGLIACLLLLTSRGDATQPSERVVNTALEKDGQEVDKDLTNEDRGLDSTLEAAIPEIARIDKATVDGIVTGDVIGKPETMDKDLAANVLGNLTDIANPGALGEAGRSISGSGGELGIGLGTLAGRSGATKSQAIQRGGGNEASELAVARGLAWLARQQKSDGSWVFETGQKEEVIAATGLGLLPFLAAGETHKKTGKYQKTVANAVTYLIRNLPPSGQNPGKFTGARTMYAQAIGALALCEAYGMTRDRTVLPAAQASINYIQRGQGRNGSWGYQAGNEGDTSIVGWQVQALKAAQLSKDIVVDDKVVKKAVEFLNLASSGSRKAEYGYRNSERAAPGTSLTAVGLLCRYYIDGWGPDNAGMAEGVQGLMKLAPAGTTKEPRKSDQKPRLDMYYYYYATQVVHFFEGDEWKDWNEGPKGADGKRKGGMRDWLIELQVSKQGDNFGSFDPDASWMGRSCGRMGTTAMCILTLEVYYRHLPSYKRSNAADPKLLEAVK